MIACDTGLTRHSKRSLSYEIKTAIEMDNLDKFRTELELIKMRQIGDIISTLCNDPIDLILANCCRFNSVKILKYILSQYQQEQPNVLKTSFIQAQDEDLNNLPMICVVGNNTKSSKRQQQQQRRKKDKQLTKNKCLCMILTIMKEMLNKKEFLQVLSHKNVQKHNLLTLLTRSNDQESIEIVKKYQTMMNCMFFCCLLCHFLFFFFIFQICKAVFWQNHSFFFFFLLLHL